ncbi:MAG: DUF362 domain-containing protein [Bacteroidales bacterium]|nr:DUF362 domain-containing protein [Bacteroidales bacterium]
MKRRDFLVKGLGASFAAGLLAKHTHVFSAESAVQMAKDSYDLVAVMGGEPDVMFDRAIAAMGGISKYVKKGMRVVVKPNIGWDKAPEYAANTNPLLVKRIVEHCIQAGAKEVIVFDNTCDQWQRCYSNSGIEKAVKDAGGKLVPGNSESYYHSISISGGKRLKQAKEHEAILESDVFINVPVLKSHGGATLTIAMKNMMGIVWDRGYWHRNDLHQCIADFASYRKPTLNVIDAYRVMKQNGPKGVSLSDVITMKSLIISEDIVAADAAAAKLFGLNPDNVDYIKLASQMGIGNMNLEKLNIGRIKI